MFTINTGIKGCQKPLQDWFIIVNGQKCQCDKSIAMKISPIIQDFYKNKKNEDSFYATKILDDQTLSDPSKNSGSSFCSIYKIISKLFSGEEIICQEDNFKILYLIGKHFRIQEIINTIEEYQKYLEMITSQLKNRIDFKEMIVVNVGVFLVTRNFVSRTPKDHLLYFLISFSNINRLYMKSQIIIYLQLYSHAEAVHYCKYYFPVTFYFYIKT